MNVYATAKFIRIAPRKTRLVVSLVRGLAIEEARRQLAFSKKEAAKPVLKVLDSAVANAKNNFGLDTKDFVIVKAFVDEGPKFVRYTPKAHGRATPIRRRCSHIRIEIGEKVAKGKAVKEVKEMKEVKSKLETKAPKKPAVKRAPKAKK